MAKVHGGGAGLHLMITFDDELKDTELAHAAFEKSVRYIPFPGTANVRQSPALETMSPAPMAIMARPPVAPTKLYSTWP
jgi:hypothetical protein